VPIADVDDLRCLPSRDLLRHGPQNYFLCFHRLLHMASMFSYPKAAITKTNVSRCLLFYIFREPVILEIPLFGHGNRSLNFRVADNT
jgi:hypothetical protein